MAPAETRAVPGHVDKGENAQPERGGLRGDGGDGAEEVEGERSRLRTKKRGREVVGVVGGTAAEVDGGVESNASGGVEEKRVSAGGGGDDGDGGGGDSGGVDVVEVGVGAGQEGGGDEARNGGGRGRGDTERPAKRNRTGESFFGACYRCCF